MLPKYNMNLRFLPVPESSRTKSEHWDILSFSLLKKSDMGLLGTSWFIRSFRQLMEAASGSSASNKRSGSSTPKDYSVFHIWFTFNYSVSQIVFYFRLHVCFMCNYYFLIRYFDMENSCHWNRFMICFKMTKRRGLANKENHVCEMVFCNQNCSDQLLYEKKLF